jgi:hypothetical protein
MSNPNSIFLEELKRISRVSDMMVTAHTSLRERFALLSLFSDISLFSCSLFLTVIVFADPVFMIKYLGNNYSFWIGIFSVSTFIFSFIARLLDWKIRAEKHRYAFKTYMNIKFDAADLIYKIEKNEHADVEQFLERYHALTPTIIAIPERDFLKYKRKHVSKVFISKYIDEHPAVSILVLKIKIWIRENISVFK